jgi:hypothetical protein
MHGTEPQSRDERFTADDLGKAIVGIKFPAGKAEIAAYVARRVAPSADALSGLEEPSDSALRRTIEALPERTYQSVSEVTSALGKSS